MRAARLEDRIGAHVAVHRVCASPITGNLLVIFDPGALDLRALIDEVISHAIALREGTPTDVVTTAAWHAIPGDEALQRLGSTKERGLSTGEAEARLASLGANRLPVAQPKSGVAIFAGHLRSVPVLLLGAAAALSLASGAVVDAVVILAVVGANAVIGYLTESRVERILTSLQNAAVPQATLRRDGKDVLLPATLAVPGDIVVLKAGHNVTVDARIIEAVGLALDESALTGESIPVTKTAAVVVGADGALADRLNMVFAGTVVAEGSGLAVVTATGRNTEIGHIRTLVAETATPPTPLERQLDDLGRRLVGVSLGFCGITLVLGVVRGVPLLEMLRTVISLAVAAVPEGLPAVATTTLALGMHRMMLRRALVRRLAAVESLGATTVICADKTGTLTENRMSVHSWYLAGRRRPTSMDGQPPDQRDRLLTRALMIGALCNEAELADETCDMRGSSTEAALLQAAQEAGIDYRALRAAYRRRSIRPREDGTNWMATIHDVADGRRLVAVKGAPEAVVERSQRWFDGDVERPLTAAVRREALRANRRLATQGMRVLGLAFKEDGARGEASYDDLVWVGLVALTDPVRAGVREAIAACRQAGIRAVMITGDQAQTAAAIYRELGLAGNGQPRVVDAAELARLDQAALQARVHEVDVFARVTPAHKYQIVRALQSGGEVVAMTGDGINDAAALRAADIGVAMGAGGTDVARDVADVVLLDDDFGSIVKAVEQGRTIHDNIRKTLRFLLSTNFSEILVTLGALALEVARPMSAIQFLWINLISDVFPALALAVEPPEADVMERPPRHPGEPILSRAALGGIAGDAAVLSAATLGAHGLALARYGAGARATTVAFSTLTGAQLLHALACRSPMPVAESLRQSPMLIGVVGGSLALQAGAMTIPPLRRLLGTTPLSGGDWGLVIGGAAAPLFLRGITQLVRGGSQRPGIPSASPRGGSHGRQEDVT